MQFQFRKMAQSDQPIEFHETLDTGFLKSDRNDILSAEPMQVDLHAKYRVDQVVEVNATLKLDLQVACARCLTPVNLNRAFSVHEEFRHGEEPENVAEEDDTVFVNSDTVDLRPYLEEAALVDLPAVVLCKDDCKGLCPTCGVNLNEQDCDCDNRPIDPRLAGLKDLFK
ncbi:YceD family protein [Paenibacillus sp. WLX1005]|uniref:YceD family protein n=1 Tax=unclassified Paenibacillus TaxID=185978 RepID=UPI0039840E69